MINEIEWTGLMELRVSWNPLTLEEARGFIAEYAVTYSSDDGRRKRSHETGTVTVPGDATSVTLTGLDHEERYSVSVAARTVAGQGVSSPEFNAPGNKHLHCCMWYAITTYDGTTVAKDVT